MWSGGVIAVTDGMRIVAISDLPVAACPPDLPLVLEPRLLPLCVPLHLRRVGRAELPGHEVENLARHVNRILQERAEPPHRSQLQREADPDEVVPRGRGLSVR